MTNRTETQLEIFLSEINRDWKLNLIEEELLEDVLNLILSGENKRIEQINHLLNEDIEDLLESLDDSYSIARYAERQLGMIPEQDIEECECKELSDYDDDDLLDECASRGLNVEDYSTTDIVTESNLVEMTELFLSFSAQKQNEILNNLKQ